MTKEMLEEFIKELKRKNRILLIVIAIMGVLLVCMTAFAFSTFEINYSTSNDYIVDENADIDGDNASVDQNVDFSSENNPIYIICGTVILCMVVFCVGVGLIYHGKSTRENKNNGSEKKDGADNKTITVREEKEVTDNGKTDED